MAGPGLKFELRDIKIDDRALQSLFVSQRGPVANHIRAIGQRTVVTSKMLVGVRTGRLRSSIKMTRDRSNPAEYAVLVGSDVKYALVHHEGTRRAYRITPRKPGGVLRFRRGGAAVYAHSVNHPKTRGRKYLTRALRTAMAR
jgi:phage gpG-like protein